MALAQQSPDVGRELRQQQQREEFRKLPERIPEEEKKPAVKKPTGDSEATLLVKGFNFTGDMGPFGSEQLIALISEFIGRDATLAELNEAAFRIKEFYKSHGYILAQAFVPPQDVTDGIVTIQIRIGRLDGENGVDINGTDLRLDPDVAIKRFTGAQKPGEPLVEKNMERGVLMLADLPGINTSANLEPGSKPGTARIVLDVTEGPLINPRVNIDNGGGRLTGHYRWEAGVDINNISGRGDQISASFMQSQREGKFEYLNLRASHPVGYSGAKVEVSGNYLTYGAGKEFANLKVKGLAYNVGASASYPIVRNRKDNVVAYGGFDYKMLEDKSSGSLTNHRVLNIASAGVVASRADKLLGGGFTQVNLVAALGDLDLSGNKSSYDSDQGSSGAKTHGDFSKVNFSVRRIQRGTEKFYVIADFSGQYAPGNLSSSEKFQLGGSSGVRAYPGGEGSGDLGVRASLEGRYVAMSGTKLGDVRLIGFYDWGRIQQHAKASNLSLDAPNRYSLSGYGLGVNVGRPGEFDFNLTWARRIGSNPGAGVSTGKDSDGSKVNNRFWASASYHF